MEHAAGARRKEVVSSTIDAAGYTRLLRSACIAGTLLSWLRLLTGPDWYDNDSGAICLMGRGFADFLLRRSGAGRFVRLYGCAKPGNLEASCNEVLGIDVAPSRSSSGRI